MKKISRFSLALTVGMLGSASIASAQYYGLLDNFEGTERYPANVNLSSKDGATPNIGGFGSVGGGENPDVGPAGVGDSALVGGGDLSAGFGGFGFSFDVAGNAIDINETSIGRENTGITIDFRDPQADGDVWAIRIDAPAFDNSRLFTIPVTPGDTGWNTYTFNFADGTDSGGPDFTNVQGLPLILVSLSGADAAFEMDNFGFIGNYVPNTGEVEDFQGYTAGSVASAAGPLANPNTFGGAVESFVFGATTNTDISIVDVGAGDLASQWTFTGVEGGIVFDLGDPGSQNDLSGFDTLEIDLAVSEAGDTVDVLIEDINAETFAGRCSFSPAVGTTVQTFSIPFSGLTCGNGFDASAVQKVSIIPTADQGNGIVITVGDVRFVNAAANVDDWMMIKY